MISGRPTLSWTGRTLIFIPSSLAFLAAFAALSLLMGGRGYGQSPVLFIVFMLFVGSVLVGVATMVAAAIQSGREFRRNYTTLFGQPAKYAQVDPTTRIVVKRSGEKSVTRAEFRERLAGLERIESPPRSAGEG
jgi:hypothetical protein